MSTEPDRFPAPLLRPMRDGDLDEVLQIEQACHPFPWSRQMFSDCLAAGYRCVALAIPGQLAGYGIMMFGYSEVQVLNLCIRAELRGRGHARALLEYLLRLARDGAATNALLEVRPSNLAALRLYRQAGFVQIGMRRDYYPAVDGREDALVLRKSLG
jgi:ribosomal-protein-alanine N-acetyltransferase